MALNICLFACNAEITVNCDYMNDQHSYIDQVYKCDVTHPTNVVGNETIKDFTGVHVYDKSESDVTYISLFYMKCEKLPSGFAKYFPNIRGIYAGALGLTSLSKNDLESFPELRVLHCNQNKLQQLPYDLFEGNPLLKYISFSNNQLKVIGSGILYPIRNLAEAWFGANICVEMVAVNNTKEMENLQKAIHENCSVEISLRSEIDKLKLDLTKVDQRLKGKDKIHENLLKIHEKCQKELSSRSIPESIVLNCEIIEINEEQSCKLNYLKVTSPNISIDSVVSNQLSNEWSTIKRLEIIDEEANYLPINLNEFFSHLTELSVRSSKLMAINGEAFNNMTFLTSLVLPSNILKFITKLDFIFLRNLLLLDLSFNEIETIETGSFDTLIELVELKLNNNLLTNINQEYFSNLVKLEVLSLQNNKLELIEAFGNLTNLERINLSGNRITSFDAGTFDKLTRLTLLDISKNSLCHFPSNFFGKLKNLKYLNAEHNKLTKIESNLVSKDNLLKEVYFNDNQISEVDKMFIKNLKFLTAISFKNNICTMAVFPGNVNLQTVLYNVVWEC